MTTIEIVVIIASLVGSLFAVCVNIIAARKLTSTSNGVLLRLAFSVSAVFATVYHVAYWWLLFNSDEPAYWSSIMRPFGPFGLAAWIIGPWTLLPAAIWRHSTKLASRMRDEAAQIITQSREEPT